MRKILFVLSLILTTQVSYSQSALNFNGPADQIQTTYSGVIGTADRTIEAWIWVDSNAPNANLTISDYGRNTAGDRNTFMVNASRNLAYISGGGSTGNFSSTTSVPYETWTHVAFVMSNRVGFLYINGVQVGTNSLSAVSTPSGQTNVIIGQRISGGSIPFYGSMDEIRFWNTARTSAQLLANMNAEFCTIPLGLKAYFRFNEGVAGGINTSITTALEDIDDKNGTLTGFLLTAGDSSNYVSGPTLVPGFSKSIVQDSLCDPFTSPSGKIFSTSGVYMDTLTNSVSCDSLLKFDLVISSITDSVQRVGGRMTSIDTWAIHQWVRCDSGYAPIPGATSRIYDATQAGDYAVIISKGNCSDTSRCISISLTGLKTNSLVKYSVFPNPTESLLTFQTNQEDIIKSISVTDISGKTILNITNIQRNTLDVSSLENGVYFLRIFSADGLGIVKFVKK